MNTHLPDHFLEELLLRVARRADELATRCARPTKLNRECWLIAEAEILQLVPLFAESAEAGNAGLALAGAGAVNGSRFSL